MSELWFQQNFLSNWFDPPGAVGGRFARCLTYDTVFLNGTFGWSPDLYTNIRNGGPGFPWCAGSATGSAFELVDLPRAVFQGFPPTRQSAWIRWDLPLNGYFSIHELIFRTIKGPGPMACRANLAAGSTRRPIQMPVAATLELRLIFLQTRCFTAFLSLLLAPVIATIASKLPHHL